MNIFDRDFPKIMGVLNVTPDSFSDGGWYYNPEEAIDHALKMIESDVDIIDIGGESTRPGAEPVSIEEELKRVIPVIKGIRLANKGIKISIDTQKYEVAKAAIEEGANIINDVSALDNDIRIAELAATNDLELILMHKKGTPKDMQNNPMYNDVVEEVFNELKRKINLANSYGVNKIIADVGIGFGKTVEHNLKLLKYHSRFEQLGVPLLLGISRKSFIGKILEINEPKDRDCATALLHSLLLYQKIDIIRVHNVDLLLQLKKIYYAFKQL